MSRNAIRVSLLGAAAVAASIGGIPAAAADQGCTGATASTVSRVSVPFGTTIVAPTAQSVPGNLGQTVIKPEATASHDSCPTP